MELPLLKTPGSILNLITEVPYLKETETELGNNPQPQLYDLRTDEEEKNKCCSKAPRKGKRTCCSFR